MPKRYYKENEFVWLVAEKTKAKVISLDIPNLSARVSVKQGNGFTEKTVKFTEMDKLKTEKNKWGTVKTDTILFAKFRDNAIIPSKREEDGAYDIYCALEPKKVDGEDVYEMLLKKGQPNLVPTGLAMSLLPKYAFNLKAERGSTGTKGLTVLCGLVDSGYRNEVFVNIVPLHKDVLLTSETDKVEDLGETILYPTTKAIAQGYVQHNLHLAVKEIPLTQLQAIPSARGLGRIGSSGK